MTKILKIDLLLLTAVFSFNVTDCRHQASEAVLM
jgi:hypothetical protein